MSEGETWKDVVGYEGFYKVSNKGNVYSVERKNSLGNKCGGRTLKPITNKDGYIYIGLYKGGIRKRKRLHRLVAETFLPNPNNYPEINHRDEDKANNNVENLEWCTRGHNVNYGTRNKQVGKKLSKKVRAVNIKTGEVLIFNSTQEARNEGYLSSVSLACRGVHKNGGGNLIGGDGHTYKGYRWSYEG